MGRPCRQKIEKQQLNYTLDPTDIYGAFHPTVAKYAFSSVHETFSQTDHKTGHKRSLNKFLKTEIMLSILSDHNAIKSDITKKNFGNYTKYAEIVKLL
jgi:hypothetical protein